MQVHIIIYVLHTLKMASNVESLCLYSTLTTFFTFDTFYIKLFYRKDKWGRRRYILDRGMGKTKNEEWGAGGWRWQIQMIKT